jgi:hypothetical protein
MEFFTLYLCGVWFWMTRRRRVTAYCAAAETLELAHAYLMYDFSRRPSTLDRGHLLPQQREALSILQQHATDTYVTATRFASLRECCRYVAAELRQVPAPVQVAPAAEPIRLVPAPAKIRIRFAANRALRLVLPTSAVIPAFTRMLRAETSGSMWKRRPFGLWPVRNAEVNTTPAEQPLKAA